MRAAEQTESGFSLIEVLVATLVLAAAAAGAAGLCWVATASVRTARVETTAALLAIDKLERLRGLSWFFDGVGGPVSDLSTDLTRDPVTAGGVGLTPSPPDALERNRAGYVDFLDEAGRWVAGGTEPPPAAVYVRRWSIQPLPGDAGDTLVLQVLVAPVAAARVGGGPGRTRVPGDVLLASVRTRKGE